MKDIFKQLLIVKAIMIGSIWIGTGLGAFMIKEGEIFVVAFLATISVLVWGNHIIEK
ncbi:MAG: hypothetical protein AABY22_14730 [Nanoarchaeota archaeon]